MKLKNALCSIFPSLIIGLLLFTTSCEQKSAKTDSDVDYYTCSMHPSVKSKDPKAKCPICSMDLTPVKKKGAGTKSDADSDYYTCTMHPSVRSKDPKAKCPICGMDLVLVKKKAGAAEATTAGSETNAMPMATANEEQPTEFMVPVARQQQIGVTYATVEKKPLHLSIRTVGMVTYEKQRHWDYVSRVDGYVQKLNVSSRGEIVAKGAPLLTIYSPELLTTTREFLNSLRMRDDAKKSGLDAAVESANRYVDSAKVRLRLFNINDDQIAKIEESRQATETITLYSPFHGVVQDIGVDQGRHVNVGDHLVDVTDLSVVWVWAEFFQEELPLVKVGQPVVITTSAYKDTKFEGKVASVDPFINESKRTGRVRIDVPNPDFKLRPEMYVDVTADFDQGSGLAVSVNAVMPTGKHNVVFVDKGEGKLEPRFVELARKYGDVYEVKSGLKDGERVVDSANFLIDAESKVQGALKSW